MRRFKLRSVLVLVAVGACARSVNTLPPAPVHFEPLPRYPEMMRVAGIEGVVELKLPIAADGVPGRVRIAHSTHDLLFHSVRAAVASWRFTPARQGTRPIADTARIRFEFVLDTTSRCPPAGLTRRAGDPPPPRKPDPGPISTFDPATGRGQVMVCHYPHERILVHE